MESMYDNLNEAGRFNYYHSSSYGRGWHRGNRGDHVSGCVDADDYCSSVDVHNMSSRKVVPAVKKFIDKLAKMPGLTVLNKSGSAFESKKEDGTIYFKILEVPQGEISQDSGWKLYDGFGVVSGPDQDTVVNDREMNHPHGKDMEILFQIPPEMYSSDVQEFKSEGQKLTYDLIIKDNPKVRDFLGRVLSNAAFNKFYGIETQAEPVEVGSDAKKLVFAFWAIQKKVKATGLTDSVADQETIKKIRALLDSPEGKAAFGKYYAYARSFIYKNFPGVGVSEALEILDKCGINYQRD